MKLRALALLLVLANLVFFVWSRGWLDGWTGTRAAGQSEPERLARQVRPQTLHVLPGAAGVAAMAGSALAGTCLEAGPFSAAEAEAALAKWVERGVPAGRIVARAQPGGEVRLRVESADAALAARLVAGSNGSASPARAFTPCVNY
ncbi:MAG TPA: hypothetical protein VF291_06940 [Burkholderiaceae bacterium]